MMSVFVTFKYMTFGNAILIWVVFFSSFVRFCLLFLTSSCLFPEFEVIKSLLEGENSEWTEIVVRFYIKLSSVYT